jgi:S1-C subfamily serine protease
VHLIEAAALLGAINSAIAGESPVWLGTRHIAIDDGGNLTVTEVDVDSPAAAAGIQVGSLILAIDGIGLAGLDGRAALWSNVMGHHPGDTITLSVMAPGATDPTDVVVTLVPNPGSF